MMRIVVFTTTMFLAVSVAAQTINTPATTNEPAVLPEVTVTGRQDSMIGVAASATQGTVGADEIAQRPILRTGEILETIPGVIITQHAGGGKANQYFLRGFNLDHGTDFAIYWTTCRSTSLRPRTAKVIPI
ncbi:MAG TPA: TonB-dependent receptor plug domain-containing protein [Verrucomicrobiae bacterium]